MDVTPEARIKLVRSIVALAESSEHRPEDLRSLYDLCAALTEYTDDAHSVAHDLLEYIQECIKISEGNGDPKWRKELLDSIRDDMSNDAL